MSINEWAASRETSIEIAEAIFELAKGDEALAQKIWEEGDENVVSSAFEKTDENELFWGDETLSRNESIAK
ncbi:YccJ family protein [Shewanella marisflavi]|uniref:YccJ family protein n=1 Tax=Shewanella marisflavi TaxID=260364 RepID=UPI003AAAB932